MYENAKSAGTQNFGQEVRQIQPIISQLDTLEKNLCRMQEILQVLESRLSLVTRPLVDAGCKEPSQEMIHTSPVACRINAFNMMVNKQIDQVSALHDSLEI